MAVLHPLGELLLLGVVLASPLFLWAQTGEQPPAAGGDPENHSWWTWNKR